MSLPHLAQAADHQQVEWIGGGLVSILLDGATTDGQIAVMRSRLHRGAASPVHVHAEEDEMFVVLRGEGIFWAGDQRHEVSEGGVVFLPKHLPHAYRFVSEEVDLLTLCVPAGIEGFFRGAGHDVSQAKPEGWTLDPAVMAAVAAEHGQQILGPPLGEHDTMPAAYLTAG